MPPMYTLEQAVAAFWSKVDRLSPEECWMWTASRTASGGYGQVCWKRRPQRAHRISWELTHGPIPDGLLVLHHCDNPPCVNPAHLWLGTDADNIQDCVRKGRKNPATGDRSGSRRHPERVPRGSGSGMSKLTEADIPAIIAARVDGESIRSIATRLGVTKTTIGSVLSGKSWRHCPR